ncbi:MAG TPA: PilW family protein [Paucimonas sp.]|nr:PilW family protein [Paucimonas sp.]
MKPSKSPAGRRKRERGFSMVELMIASAIGLILMTGLSMILVSNMQSRDELAKNSVQIENGRFAIESMVQEIQLAGFYGEYLPPTVITWTTPNPCAVILEEMGFAAGTYRWNSSGTPNVPVGLQGYTESDTTPTCLANRKTGTDILVVRRAGTTPIKIDVNEDGTADASIDTNGDGTNDATYASLNNGYYLQVSNCSDTPSEFAFVMDHDNTQFTSHTIKPAGTPLSCLNGGFSPVRKYVVNIFYVASCNDCSGSGDGIPTLKMAELTPATTSCTATTTASCGSFVIKPIAEGIENLQLEYGVDSSPSVGDGVPDAYKTAPAAADWANVVAVKIFLLARNTDKTLGYTDTKTYSLNSAGTALSGTPFNDNYKRHVYSATARATNIAGRRSS